MNNNDDKNEAKTKVIIITRSTEYVENNEVKKDKEEYGRYILEESDNESIINKTALKSFLWAVDELKSWGDIENYDVKAKELLGVEVPYDIQWGDDTAYKEYLIKEILDKTPVLSEEDNDKRCYVHFEHEGYEIILVLWDVLGRDSEEKVEPFGLFVEKICEDCGLTDSNKAILYIHDKQIGLNKDKTILDSQDTEQIEEKRYKVLRKYFFYVAAFQHSTSSEIFKNILVFNFPSPHKNSESMGAKILSEKISDLEQRCETFQNLRNQSDDIINHH